MGIDEIDGRREVYEQLQADSRVDVIDFTRDGFKTIIVATDSPAALNWVNTEGYTIMLSEFHPDAYDLVWADS